MLPPIDFRRPHFLQALLISLFSPPFYADDARRHFRRDDYADAHADAAR